VLAILLEKPGTVVTREELQKRLWPDTFVDVQPDLLLLKCAKNSVRYPWCEPGPGIELAEPMELFWMRPSQKGASNWIHWRPSGVQNRPFLWGISVT
jgi:hypothetical protein